MSRFACIILGDNKILILKKIYLWIDQYIRNINLLFVIILIKVYNLYVIYGILLII